MNHSEILAKLKEHAEAVLTADKNQLQDLQEVFREAKDRQREEVEKGKSICEPRLQEIIKGIESLKGQKGKKVPANLNNLLKAAQAAREAWDFKTMEEKLTEMEVKLEEVSSGKEEAPDKQKAQATLKEKLRLFTGKSQKAAEEEEKRKEALEAYHLEVGLKIEEIGNELSPELRAILTEHRKAVPPESKVFDGYRWLDDVLNYVQDTNQRQKILLDINETMQLAITRQKRFFRLLDTWISENEEFANSKDGKEKIASARQLGAHMLSHIPTKWLVESSQLASRIQTLCKEPEDQERIKAEAMDISEETRTEERALFKRIIEHGSLKKMDRTAFFFDLPLRSITPEMNRDLMASYDKIIQRAYRVKDAGGTVEEVEATLDHIPAEFWPPAFIENLQAWRVVERELAEERTKALFEEDKLNLEDIGNCLNFALDTVGTMALASDMAGTGRDLHQAMDSGSKSQIGKVEAGIPCAWRDAPNVVEAITGFSEVIRNGFGYGTAVKDALVSEDYSEIDAEKLNDILDNILEQVKTFSGTLMNLTWGAQAVYKQWKNVNELPTEGFLAGEFIPVLAAVVAGIDLKQAITALGKSIKMRVKSGQMLDSAKLEYISGKRKDGGAFVRAIRNERNARNRQITQKSVDVTAKSLTFAGEVTLTATGATGFGAAAGLALKVTAKGVEYGGAVAFAVHDWSLAKTAKELMEQAQAGNPIARLEIMEKSGLYAKMYICHLARTKDRLAMEFIVQRGIREEDLQNPALSMSVVRDLLEHADQKDETQVADNLGKAIAQGVMKDGTVKVAEKLALAAKNISQTAVRKMKSRGIEYDAERWVSEDWTPPYPISLAPEDWSKNKAEAEKIGYYAQKTGIKAKLEKAHQAHAKTEETLKAFQQNQENAQEILAEVKATQKVLLQARSTVMDVFPLNIDGGPHDPMIAYLNDLRNKLGAESNKFDNRLFSLKLKDKDWESTKAASLSPQDWKSNWEDAKAKCGLDGKDEGVFKTLGNADNIAQGTELNGQDKLAARQARIGLRDAYKLAAEGLKSLYGLSSSFVGLRKYLDEMMEIVIQASQENDEELNGKPWKNNPAKKPRFNLSIWLKTLRAAVAEGFLPDTEDQGVSKALTSVTTETNKLENTRDPQKKIDLRIRVMREYSRLVKGLDKMIRDHKDTHSELLYFFAWMRQQAFEKAGALRETQENISFQVDNTFRASSWKLTYDNAIKVGAVPSEDKFSQTLFKALSTFDQRIDEINKEKNPQKRFQLAQKAKADIGNILKALSKISNAKGYRENIKMETYLSDLQQTAMQQEKEEPLKSIFSGAAGGAFETPAFIWKNKGKGGWQEVKKAADRAGLIQKSHNTTGFGASIDAVLKAEKRYKAVEETKKAKAEKRKKAAKSTKGTKATKEAESTQAKNKYLDDLTKALAAMGGLARQLGSNTAHPAFKAYFKLAQDAASEKERSIHTKSVS